ncbi:MAG: hypothetical protein U1F77_14230 [Kiritimatiellia bacterium]
MSDPPCSDQTPVHGPDRIPEMELTAPYKATSPLPFIENVVKAVNVPSACLHPGRPCDTSPQPPQTGSG